MIRYRSFSLSVAALCLTLGLWSCAGSSGGKAGARGPQAPPAHDPLNPTLAMVAGSPITRHDVDSVLATAPPSIREDYLADPEQYKMLVDRIVQQQIIYLAAKSAGVESDSAYRMDLANQQRQLIMKHYYAKVVSSLPALPDSAVRQYYESHPSEFAMPGRARVRHIQVATRAKALEVRKRLLTMSWETVCALSSTDKVTAKSGGVLGYVVSDGDQVPGVGKAPAIVAAAFRLKEGEASEPLKGPKGWHIIRADEKTEAGPQPYANVERQIRGKMESERSERFQQDLLESLKKKYGVVVYTDSIQNAMEPILTPAQLFAQAQTASLGRDRIDLFRKVVERFPNDKSAVQASFMIGFTYAEELKDYPAARAAFEDFLRRYPKSDLVASANWMLQNMEHGVPPPQVGESDTLLIEGLPVQPPGPGTPTKP